MWIDIIQIIYYKLLDKQFPYYTTPFRNHWIPLIFINYIKILTAHVVIRPPLTGRSRGNKKSPQSFENSFDEYFKSNYEVYILYPSSSYIWLIIIRTQSNQTVNPNDQDRPNQPHWLICPHNFYIRYFRNRRVLSYKIIVTLGQFQQY